MPDSSDCSDGSRLVWLLRHAKTVADPPKGGTDHQRRLTSRGRRDADAFAGHLAPGADLFGFTLGELPALVLCSTATRARQTAEQALARMMPCPTVDYGHSLYRADPDGVIEVLRQVDDEVPAVMVVGHNPTAHQLAVSLGRRDGGDGGDERGDAAVALRRAFPTCALAVLRLPTSHWREASLGTASLEGLFTPPY